MAYVPALANDNTNIKINDVPLNALGQHVTDMVVGRLQLVPAGGLLADKQNAIRGYIEGNVATHAIQGNHYGFVCIAGIPFMPAHAFLALVAQAQAPPGNHPPVGPFPAAAAIPQAPAAPLAPVVPPVMPAVTTTNPNFDIGLDLAGPTKSPSLSYTNEPKAAAAELGSRNWGLRLNEQFDSWIL
ncbi:hypothetical protein BCR33DRAFT_772165 [Rhizoclosmatium globosum]|uniref:Uncharacterized protein n=1 Tax=Rhizoclosmatium globosum TaxID=329046 RepID=A0A1Y2B6L0_9FUNG|nr:hypothetical protein BCR33DRAFT_772165 [Rhizoclosmatium globosum]|eukprot:ORY30479.1 hypothetical protein BCR33DRAFT_772165 [Rhizoclosmatium globosum]